MTLPSVSVVGAFFWEDGNMGLLDRLGEYPCYALDINDYVQVVGWSRTTSGHTHAAFWYLDAVTDLGTLGGGDSYAFAINRGGQVVGESETISGTTHATLWER